MKLVVKKLRPPFKIHGGKNPICDWIVRQFPDGYEGTTYVEPFGGAASVLLNKFPSKKEVCNDLHAPTANVFAALVSRPAEFQELLNKVEYTEKAFAAAAHVPFAYGSLDSALAELVLRRMSRGGMKKSFSWSTRTRGGRPGDLNAFETFKLQLPLICKRLRGVEVHCKNALELLGEYLDDPNVLVYADPPYFSQTRTAKKVYDCEMTDADHGELAAKLNAAKAKVLVSGYDNPTYREYYKNWRRLTKDVPNHAGQGDTKQRRLEVLWVNY